MKRHVLVLFHFVILLLIIIPSVVSAYSNTITGRVSDGKTNRPLEGVNIVIANTTFGAVTGKEGKFIVKNIPPGNYLLKATYIGYRPARKWVNLVDNESISLIILIEPTTIEGQSIIVTARADPNQAVERESPIAFTRLNKKEVAYNYTTGDLPELIKNVPGVWTSSAGLGESDIFIRGFASDGIGFMINDIPINNPEDQQVIWSNWAGLSHMTRSIEIHRGPGFSLSSPNASGGTVNISTFGIETARITTFRISTGICNRMGIQSGPDAGKIINPVLGTMSEERTWPVHYTYSGRFNSGSIYNGKLNLCLFFERKSGDSYILGTNYNGFTIGLEADYKLSDHQLYFTFFVSPQSHGQAFALQDIDLLETLGREYNRKNHEWQENFYTKPFWALKHKWRLSDNKILTNNIFFTIGRGADQTCANDAFDVETGKVGFQTSTKQKDAYAFGLHAQYLYCNYGLLTSDFVPSRSDSPFFVIKDIPFESRGSGANFFADQHSHSYQDRKRRDHRQFGLTSHMSHAFSENIHWDYGITGRYWRGHRESEVRLLKVSNFNSLRAIWAPSVEDNFIARVQSVYDYDTKVINFSAFGRFLWKPDKNSTLQMGIPFYYTRSELIENPIRLIDLGAWKFFSTAKHTTEDINEHGPKFSITNDYLRQFCYFTPWIGGNFNLTDKFNIFTRIANAKKEPAILDWYDYSEGPLLQKEKYPENEKAVSLKPESVTSIELGTGYITQNFAANANYYRTTYDDKIETVVDINERRTTMNAGKALFQGIECAARWRLNNIDFSSSATLARNRWKKINVQEIFDSDADDVAGKHVPFAPERILTASMGYNFNLNITNRFRVEFRINYWDEYYVTYTNTYVKTTEKIVDGLHYQERKEYEARLPYFLDISGHLSYTVSMKDFDFKFRIDANNILNRADNFIRAQYSIDYTRNDFQAGRYNWYVLQAPLFNFFITTEITIND